MIRKMILTTLLISLCMGFSIAGRVFVVAANAVVNECPQTYDPNLLVGDFGGSVHCYTGQKTTCTSVYFVPTSKLALVRVRADVGVPSWVTVFSNPDPNKFQQPWGVVVQPTKVDVGVHYVTVFLDQQIDGVWKTERAMTVVLCVEEEFIIEPLTGCSSVRQ
jgi:hypothetical protein